jgi:cell wall-associated NlpC family hydrolase
MADRANLAYSDLIGKPFEYGARGPDAYDCFGLVKECYRRVHGVELPDFLSPDDQGAQAAVGAIQLLQWEPVPCQAGTLAAIRIKSLVSHCGFMLDEDTMIHAWKNSGGVTLQRLNEWRHRITGFYRYAG